MKQREFMSLLRAVLVVSMVVVVLLCAGVAPLVGRQIAIHEEELAYLYWPCLIGVWVSALAVLYAGYLVWMIARDVDDGKIYTADNVSRLQLISKLAMGDVALYMAGAVFLFASGALYPAMILPLMPVLMAGAVAAVCAIAFARLLEKNIPEPAAVEAPVFPA